MNLWRLINPLVVFILRSPLHFLASKNLIFITFQGRKSKKTFNIPVSYHREGNDLIALTLKQNLWWKNLKMLNRTQITLLGKKEDVGITIVDQDTQFIKEKMRELIIEKPIDAYFAKVKLDNNKLPVEEDLEEASQKHIVLKFTLKA
jgi:ABC-type molybdate transport system ATPase subunit